MIIYDSGEWGILFIFQRRGSVLPRALVWGVTSGCAACALNHLAYGYYPVEGVSLFWSGFTSVLGFLMVFRNNTAYARFWEGTALMREMKGEWMNAGSSLIAFCSGKHDRRTEVKQFQSVLMRLMSMMHCSALQTIADVEDNRFQILSPLGIDPERLRFLTLNKEGWISTRRTEVLLQWIQRLVVEAARDGVLDVPPPVLSRVFQELSRGIVNFHNVRKIKDVPLPFPYAQVLSVMLLAHWVLTPIIASQMVESPTFAGVLSMLVQTSFWSIIYIGLEIEQPFGEDMNDLPMAQMQIDFNDSLALLLLEPVQTAPAYTQFATSTVSNEVRRCLFGADDVEEVIASQCQSTLVRLTTTWSVQAPLQRLFSPSSSTKGSDAGDGESSQQTSKKRAELRRQKSAESQRSETSRRGGRGTSKCRNKPSMQEQPPPRPNLPSLQELLDQSTPVVIGVCDEASPMRSRPRPSPRGGWQGPQDLLDTLSTGAPKTPRNPPPEPQGQGPGPCDTV